MTQSSSDMGLGSAGELYVIAKMNVFYKIKFNIYICMSQNDNTVSVEMFALQHVFG